MKRYEKYKPTGIQWLPEIPEHWNIESFGKHFSFGKGLPITKADLTKEGIAVISYGQVHSKLNLGVTLSDSLIRYVSNRWLDTNPQNLLRKCDFVFADTSEDIAGAGNCAFNDYSKPLFAGYHIVIARPTEVENSRYWAYLFQSNCWKSQVQSLVNGVKVYSINKSILKKSAILIPHISEQYKIVAYLNKRITLIKSCKCQRERELQTLNELKQAEIASVVTRGLNPDVPMKDSGIPWIGQIPDHWELRRFKTVCSLIREPSKNGDKKIALENIETNTGRLIATDSVFDGEGVHFEPGDILFGKLRPYLAKVYLAKESAQAVGDFYVFRSNGSIIPAYLHKLIISAPFIGVVNAGTYGTKMPRASWQDISQLNIPLPPIEEQNAIVEYIESKTNKIDTMIEALKAEIDRLTEYKQRLISDVVTGQIDVRGEQIQ